MSAPRVQITAGTIFRLSKRSPDEVHYAENRPVPLPEDYRLSDKEQAAASKSGAVGSLSVWDRSRSTPAQAAAFGTTPKRIAFLFTVEAVLALQHHLRVFRVPLADARPGADGHCVIEDVYGGSEQKMKEIRADIMGTVTGFEAV